MSTETPDAETAGLAYEAWVPLEARCATDAIEQMRRRAFLAGYAARLDALQAHLDAKCAGDDQATLDRLHAEPLPADHEAVIHAEKQGHENGWNAAGAALRDMRDELSRSRAECQHLNDRLDEAGELIASRTAERDALRAENQRLRDNLPSTECSCGKRIYLPDVDRLRVERDALHAAITALADEWDYDADTMDVIPLDAIHGPEAATRLRALLTGDDNAKHRELLAQAWDEGWASRNDGQWDDQNPYRLSEAGEPNE